MKIKAVFFDIGGVLMRINPMLPFQRMQLPLTYQEALQQIVRWPVFLDFEKGKISTTDFITEFNQHFQIHLSPQEFLTAWNTCLQEVLPGMEEIVAQVSRRVRVFTLSNTNHAHYEYFSKLSIFRYFEEILTSFGLGVRKPDPLIYQLAAQKVSLSPQEILFIDDMEENVIAARHQGLQAEQSVNDSEKTKQILKNYSVL